jgi:hypothetical protein
MGKMPILDTYEESNDAWRAGAKDPDFFVVDDDMYGLSVRVEASWNLAKRALLGELVMFLNRVNRPFSEPGSKTQCSE